MPSGFSSSRPNRIESDAGFAVEVSGRTGIRYSEDDRVMLIDSEVLATPGAIALYRSSIREWDSSYEAQTISEEERERIINNIRNALSSLGHTLQVI